MVRIPLEASFYPPEQSRPGHRRGDPRRDRTGRAFHRQAHRAADPGGLERTTAALRLPDTVTFLTHHPRLNFSGGDFLRFGGRVARVGPRGGGWAGKQETRLWMGKC